MKRIIAMLFALCVLATAQGANASGHWVTYGECQDGCPIGDHQCYSYCSSLFDPCFNKCAEEARDFIPNCIASDRQCPSNQTRYTCCRDLLYIVNAACKNECRAVKKYVEYPDWMPEQQCPYDCQKWNPASRTCVGAKMNGCGGW